jgi:hypothetical protein
MAKLAITDGIALLELSRLERYELGRKYIAFDLNQVMGISIIDTPNDAEFGKKTKFHWVSLAKTGVYQNGDKVSVLLGPKRPTCVRVVLLNPYFTYLYLTFGDQSELLSRLKGKHKRAGYPKG